MSPPRVALVARGAHVAGGEVSLLTLAAELPPRAEPLVWTTEPGELESRARDAGLPVRTGRWEMFDRRRPVGFARLVGEIASTLRSEAIDLVHVNSPVEAGAFIAAARLVHRPCVVHVRIHYDREFLRRQFLGWADAVVFNSRALRASVGWPGGVVVPNGVRMPAESAPGERERIRTELGIAPGELLLAQVGQVIPVKGVDTSLRAVARLRRDWPVRLVVIGDDHQTGGGYRGEMERLATDLGIDDAVTFLGYRRDALRLAAGFDLLLCPSRVEPFGRVLIESMAQGVPVVATRVGGIPEVVRPGQDGWLVPPDDPSALAAAAASLLADPAQRQEFGAMARRRARTTFSGATHARSILGLYDRVRSVYPEACVG